MEIKFNFICLFFIISGIFLICTIPITIIYDNTPHLWFYIIVNILSGLSIILIGLCINEVEKLNKIGGI